MFDLLKMMFSATPGWIKTVEANGRAATAVVLALPKEVEALKGVGGYEGKDAWVEAQVQVQPPDVPPFEAGMKCKLSQAVFGMLAVGTKVNVRYDPQDQKRVLLVDDVNTLLGYRVKK